jgi:hypothetical protein
VPTIFANLPCFRQDVALRQVGWCAQHVWRADDTQRYTLLLLPIWVLAGVADYLWHRRTRIETTSGTEESLTHTLWKRLAAAAFRYSL